MILDSPIHTVVVSKNKLLWDSFIPAAAVQGIEVVAVIAPQDKVLQVIKSHLPDIVIVDVSADNDGGWGVLYEIHESHPDMALVHLDSHPQKEEDSHTFIVGRFAQAFHEDGLDELINTCQVLTGMPASIAVVSRPERSRDQLSGLRKLSAREYEIFKLLASGKTAAEIADELFISHRTVEKHRSNLMVKLDIHRQYDLFLFAAKSGVLSF